MKKAMYDGDGVRFRYGECKKIIDVSSYNGNNNWSVVKAGGVDREILRITSFSGGLTHEDDKFVANLSRCRNAGMPFGIYV